MLVRAEQKSYWKSQQKLHQKLLVTSDKRGKILKTLSFRYWRVYGRNIPLHRWWSMQQYRGIIHLFLWVGFIQFLLRTVGVVYDILRQNFTTAGDSVAWWRCFMKFLTSDNAILAIWLVHCLGYQPLYLRLTFYRNECGKCRSAFLRQAKFRRQKNGWEKKDIFSELCTEEIQEITDNSVPVTTENPQSSGWDYSTGNLKVAKFERWTFRFFAFMKIA